jgi:uncharacterized protein YdaU (DUF1376 family)
MAAGGGGGMTEIPAMLLWTDAYLGDTSHLTTFEHGAYLLILMAMWRAGGSLPDDDETMARCAKVTLDKWRRISPRILAFMEPVETVAKMSQKTQSDTECVRIANGHVNKNKGLITQKRLWQELKIAQSRKEKQRFAGFVGNAAKALKKQGTHNRSATAIGDRMRTKPEPYIKKDFINGELRQESRWVPTKMIGNRRFRAGELAPAYDGQPPWCWKKLRPEDCQ